MVHLGAKRKVEIYKSYFARNFCLLPNKNFASKSNTDHTTLLLGALMTPKKQCFCRGWSYKHTTVNDFVSLSVIALMNVDGSV